MLRQIAVSRDVGDGRRSDVLDVAEYLGERDYGTAANALVVMVRDSAIFQKTLPKLKEQAQPEPAREAG